MKKLSILLTLILVTGLFTAAISGYFHTDPTHTLLAVSAFQATFYGLTYFNIIPMPVGVLGDYVGAPGTQNGSAGVQVISTERDRAVYMNHKTSPDYEGKDIVQGYLRMEAQITNSSNILTFKTFEGDGNTVYATERRLDRNDKFVITELGMFLLKQDVLNAKTNGRLLTYPNITVLGAAAAADLMALYTSGEIQFTINKKKIVVGLDCGRFLYVPETQQSGAGNYDEVNSKSGFTHLTPQISLDGSGTNEITMQFKSYAGWAGGTVINAGGEGNQHRVALICKGLLITGGSAVS